MTGTALEVTAAAAANLRDRLSMLSVCEIDGLVVRLFAIRVMAELYEMVLDSMDDWHLSVVLVGRNCGLTEGLCKRPLP